MVEPTRYIDVNMFVYWLGNHPNYAQTAKNWIQKIEESPRGKYYTSSLTLYETTVILAGLTGRNLKDKTFITQVITPITALKPLTIEPLKSEDYKKAAENMGKWELDYEDSLHLAVAERVGAQEIVSNDKDFDKTEIKRTM